MLASIVLAAYLLVGFYLAWIDLRTQTLPDRIVLPATGALALGLVLSAAISNDWDALWRALSAGLALFAVFFLLRLISPGSLGGGDVKLSASMGMALGWLGWLPVIYGTFWAYLLAAAWAIAGLVSRKLSRKSQVAFGPFMILGLASQILPALFTA